MDGDGDDTYTALTRVRVGGIDGSPGANGGGYNLGVGMLLDAGGDDAYTARHRGVNGGGASIGVGFLVDATGDDTYSSHGAHGANGSAWLVGAGTLADGTGNDSYLVTPIDEGSPGSLASNGGGTSVAVGLLVDTRGCDVYQDADPESAGRDRGVAPKGDTGGQLDMSACPIAAGTPDRTTTDRVTTVRFTNSSTDPDGEVVGWRWDFGDGHASSEQHPTHTYGALGSFQVQLTVTDNLGEIDTVDVATITVENLPPTLRPLDDPTVYEGDALSLRVKADDPDDAELTYGVENLPDGASFDAQRRVFSWTPDHTQAGTFDDVRFTVADVHGGRDEAAITITVLDRLAPVAPDFSWTPKDPSSKSTVSFRDETDDLDDRVTGHQWSFGDGAWSTDQAPKHEFPGPGTTT